MSSSHTMQCTFFLRFLVILAGIISMVCLVGRVLASASQRLTVAAPHLRARRMIAIVIGKRALDMQNFSQEGPKVRTGCGEIEGVWERMSIGAFRGIPYGTPPIGQRRWRPAEPFPCWSPDKLFANHDGPACYQGGSVNDSEACLYLNVFVPKGGLPDSGSSSGVSVPVLVWIHGGANVVGSASSYGPMENIVQREAHVLVTVNYRLGIFGNLALRELAEMDPRGVSGNLGITDQQLALRWVQQNIAAFGGNQHSVTIFGQSSGGTNVLAHIASATSRGLFHRAISLSGSPNITMDRATKEAQDRKLLLPRTACADLSDEQLLDCLYNLTAAELYAALPGMGSPYGNFSLLYDYPTDHKGLYSRVKALVYVDGFTITKPLEEALLSRLNDVPLLLQSTQAEMDFFPVPNFENMTDAELMHFYEEQFLPTYGAEMPLRVYDLYSKFRSISPEYAVYAVDSDTSAACGLRSLALKAGATFTSPVYWSTVVGFPSNPYPATSSLESRFPFHNWDVIAAAGLWSGYDPSHEDLQFGQMVLGQWSMLATYGYLGNSSWKPVQTAIRGHTYSSIITKNVTRPVFDEKADVCEFWESVGVSKNWWWIN